MDYMEPVIIETNNSNRNYVAMLALNKFDNFLYLTSLFTKIWNVISKHFKDFHLKILDILI